MPNLSIIPSRAVRDQRLSDTQVRVLCAIGTFTNKLGGNVWASVRTLAAQSGLSERSVQRAIPSLIEHGYVVRIERPGRTNLYEVVLHDAETAVQEPSRGDSTVGGGVTGESPERPKGTTPKQKSANAEMTELERECVELIWAEFPKRDTPHAYVPSRKAILELLRSGVASHDLVSAMDEYAKHLERERTEPRYVKSLQRFFSDGFWQAFSVVRVHGRTREEWKRSGQDVLEFDMLAAGR